MSNLVLGEVDMVKDGYLFDSVKIDFDVEGSDYSCELFYCRLILELFFVLLGSLGII